MRISLNALSVNSRAANRSLLVTTVAYLLLNGAQLFETAVLVPVWTAAHRRHCIYFRGNTDWISRFSGLLRIPCTS